MRRRALLFPCEGRVLTAVSSSARNSSGEISDSNSGDCGMWWVCECGLILG